MDDKELDKILESACRDIAVLGLYNSGWSIEAEERKDRLKTVLQTYLKDQNLALLKAVEEALPNCDSGCKHKDTYQGHRLVSKNEFKDKLNGIRKRL